MTYRRLICYLLEHEMDLDKDVTIYCSDQDEYYGLDDMRSVVKSSKLEDDILDEGTPYLVI